MESVFLVIVNALVYFMTIDIPLGAILLGIPAFYLIYWAIRQRIKPWRHYKRDQIKHWLFTWDYAQSWRAPKIINLNAICDECGCTLSGVMARGYIGHGEDRLYCPNDDKKFRMFYRTQEEDIKKIIIHRIINGEYLKIKDKSDSKAS